MTKIIFLLLTIFLIDLTYGAKRSTNTQLVSILKLYKKGNYQDAIKKLSYLEKNKSQRATAQYWKGLCYSKLQEYELANKYFGKALKFKNPPKDLYYEYGQSLYANDKLKRARKAFLGSAKRKFKTATSVYYVAYLSQLLEEYPIALKYFKKINSLEKIDRNLAQAANLQIAEIILIQAEKKENPVGTIKDYVLPQFEVAYEVAENSILATDIQTRIRDVKKKYDLDKTKLANGKKLSEKPYKVKVKQAFVSDSNVTLESDSTNVSSTSKDSFIHKTTAQGSYRFISRRRITTTPQLRIIHEQYTEDKNPSVYQNNSDTFTGSLKNEHHHTINKNQANAILDLDYTYIRRDHDQDKEKEYYSRAWTITAGEKLKYFDMGATTAKVKYKSTENTSSLLDSTLFTLSLSQTTALPNKQLLISTISFDNNDSNTDTSDNKTYDFRFSYIGPIIFEKVKIEGGLGISFLDTMKQSSTRGVEKKYNPSVKLARPLREYLKGLEASAELAYTKNTSKSTTNEYSKTEIVFELEYKL
jgi:tetratricopeptide (TPR) repeat protein